VFTTKSTRFLAVVCIPFLLPYPFPYERFITNPFLSTVMSESQRSDFASSLYDGDIDTLTYLAPSNQPVTPAPSSSQKTFDAFDSEFLRPVIPLVVPSSLTRVGPDRRKAFVLYDEMTHSDWVDWWLQTDYGRKSRIHWDSSHQSDIWSDFHQVAHGIDGAPKVMCKRCGQILEHPYFLSKGADGKDQRHGLSTMEKTSDNRWMSESQ
jgi:hypothetical protein